MDFRSMLKKKKYAKWKQQQEKEEVDLKEVDKDPKPALKKVERVSVIKLFKQNPVILVVILNNKNITYWPLNPQFLPLNLYTF
jgi:hypothetical protein